MKIIPTGIVLLSSSRNGCRSINEFRLHKIQDTPDRQIGTLYFERLLASRDREPVRNEAAAQIEPLQKTPREFVRDPVLLEFLGLPETGCLLEAELEQALINKLQGFLLELGKGFAFVARQMRIGFRPDLLSKHADERVDKP